MSRRRRYCAPQEGPQSDFLSSEADIVIYGGSAGGGKTWAILFEVLRHIHNGHFGAVVFRRLSTQIRNEGGLWDESAKIYPLLGAEPKESVLEWTFPSGAGAKFAHLQYDSDKYGWQGSQIPLLMFDELTHFTEGQFWYMLSRNRSTCGVRPYVRATTNPVPEDDPTGGWVARLIAWWIDQDEDSPTYGLAIPERSGVVRWFIRKDGEELWGDSLEEMVAKHGAFDPSADPEDSPKLRAKSLTFIRSSVWDNKILLKSDPGYLSNLMAQDAVERARLLDGNWKARAASGKVFNRAWFQLVDAAPSGMELVRYWDKAGTAGSGDYTAGVLMGYHRASGLYYVLDVIRGQWSALERESVILQAAQTDGHRVAIWVEQEPGSGGKESAQNTIRNLAGYTVHAEAVTGEKVSRMGPLSAQAEAGNVRLLRADWNKTYLDELHAIPDGKNDDMADASAGAFNKLTLRPPARRTVAPSSRSSVSVR